MELTQDQNTPEEALQPPQRHTLLFVVGFLLFLGTIAFSVYLNMQKSALQSEQVSLTNEISSLENEMAQFKTGDVEAEQSAKAYLEDIQRTEIRWSSVLKSLRELIPTGVSGKPKIVFTSYSGTTGGKLNLTAQTQPASKPPADDIAEILELFQDSTFFKDAFVSQYSATTAQNGEIYYSFPFQVTYAEEFPINGSTLSSDIPFSSSDSKVPSPSSNADSKIPVSNPNSESANAGSDDSDEENSNKVKRQ